MTDTSLRPLPILTSDGELPTGKALEALKAAKMATGYSGMVLPVKAVPGSPGPVLAVGAYPSWLVTYAYLPDFSSVERLTAALTAVLINNEDPRLGNDTTLLSQWFGGEVKFLGVEEYVEPNVWSR